MNNQRGISRIIIILNIIVLFVVGFLVWEYFIKPEKEVKKDQEEPVGRFPQETLDGNGNVGEETIIPAEIALNDEKLKNFLIEHKLRKDPSFLSHHQISRRDLNKDGLEEIMVGFGIFGPSVGYIGLIATNDGEKYKIINWERVVPAVVEMRLKNLPNDNYHALVVELTGGLGTGMSYHKMHVYVYINNQFKLTFDEFIEEIVSVGAVDIENIYEINFKDVDDDGYIEILQKGRKKEVARMWSEEKNDYVTIRETSVEVSNVFKWDEKEKVFKKIDLGP